VRGEHEGKGGLAAYLVSLTFGSDSRAAGTHMKHTCRSLCKMTPRIAIMLMSAKA